MDLFSGCYLKNVLLSFARLKNSHQMTNSTFGCQGNKDNFFFLFFQLYGKQSVPLTEIRAHQLFFTAQLYHIFIRKFIFSNFSYILMNATSISPSLLLLLLYSQPPYSPQ